MKIASLINHPDRKEYTVTAAALNGINIQAELDNMLGFMGKVGCLYVTNFFLWRKIAIAYRAIKIIYSIVMRVLTYLTKQLRSIALATNCYNWHLVPSRIKAN